MPSAMIFRHPQLALRAVSDADQAFLQRLYASVREEELRPTGWPEAQKAAFLAMQFQAQHRAYAAYSDTEYFIVQRGQQDIGRLYLQHQPEAMSIVDISLMADTRGQGIGSDLLQAVFAQARAAHKAVQIHVEKFNPALRLYQRLGFVEVEDKGVYLLMRRAAETD